jgi:hypothetical protein
MESTLRHVTSPSELTPGHDTGTPPFAQQTVVLTKQAYIELTWQANYWRAQYEQLLEREAALKAAVEAQQATIRDLTQRLYGTKSEKATRPHHDWRPHVSQPPEARSTARQSGARPPSLCHTPRRRRSPRPEHAGETLRRLWGSVPPVACPRSIHHHCSPRPGACPSSPTSALPQGRSLSAAPG